MLRRAINAASSAGESASSGNAASSAGESASSGNAASSAGESASSGNAASSAGESASSGTGRETADEARFAGITVYRGLVPAHRLAHLLVRPRVLVWLGPGQHCVCYPISGGRLISFVAATQAADWHTESWTAPGRVEELVGAYVGWHQDVRGVLSAADSVTRWALYDRPALARSHTDRLTVIGDAAHPMLPFGAQGANQAIESAVTLALCLQGTTTSELPAALARYQSIRQPRLAQVTAAVREHEGDHHLADGEPQCQRDDDLPDRRRLESQERLFGYDAERADVAAAI